MTTRTTPAGTSRKPEARPEPLSVATWLVAVAFLLLACADARRDVHFGLDSQLVWQGVRDYLRHRPVDLPYLPSSLLLLAPIGLLPLGALKLLALALTASAFIVSSCATGRLAGKGSFGTLSATSLIVVSASGVGRNALLLSNFGLAVQAGLALTIVLACMGKWRAAAIVFTMACCIKPNIAPAGLIFVAARRWRLVTLIAAGFAATNLIGALLLADRARYLQLAAGFAFGRKASSRPGASLTASDNFAISVSGPGLRIPSPAVTSLRVLVVAAAIVCVVRAWRSCGNPMSLAILALAPVLAIFLAGGLAETHYALAAIPLAGLLILSHDVAVASLAAIGSWLIFYAGRIPEQISTAERLTIGVLLLLAASVLAVTRAGARAAAETPTPSAQHADTP